jgi:O-Antigen ligase
LITGTSVRNAPSESAFTFRAVLTKAAFRLAAEAPVFGIGLNLFRPASAGVFPDDVINTYSWARHGENAHNNFLQILVELGAAGLAAFLWLLTPLFLNVWRRLTAHNATAEISGLAGGVGAFLLSALLGHPLLIEHVRPMFFLTLGIATGISASTTASRAVPRLHAVAFAIAFLVVLACLPVRVIAQRQRTNVDGVVFGASDQKGAIDGIRFRVAEAHSSWFIAGNTRAVQLPLRTTPESEQPCPVAIAFDGTDANIVSPTSDMWTRLELQLTPPPRNQRWRRLDFRVLNEHCQLVVGTFTQRR